MTKGMKYERDRPKWPLQCQKSPQELGFDLDPHKGIVEGSLKKNHKKAIRVPAGKYRFPLQSRHVQLLCALQDPEWCFGVRGHFLIHPMCAQAETLPELSMTSRVFPDNFFSILDIKVCERVPPKGCVHQNAMLDLYNWEHFSCILNWICIVQVTQSY